MPSFIVWDSATGLVKRVGFVQDADDVELQPRADEGVDSPASANVIADGRWRRAPDGTYAQDPLPEPTVEQIHEQLAAYANAKVPALLGAMIPYTSGATTIKSDATPPTLTNWMALQQWAAANPSGTTQWVANDNSVTALPASAIAPIAMQVGAYAQGVYQALATVLTAIAAGTITTTIWVDAASWPATP